MLKFLGATDLLRSAFVFFITMRFHEQPYNNDAYRLIYGLADITPRCMDKDWRA